MDNFAFCTTPGIRFGVGLARDLSDEVAAVLGPRVLFVTDSGLRSIGLTDPALSSLRSVAQVTIFDQVEVDPARATLLGAIEIGKSENVTGVIGFGGGSSMDVAKLVALILGSHETLDEIWGVGLAKGPRLPLVLVPTTAGTGSEVTPVSIITVEGDEKRGVVSPVILPDLAILDPELTLGLPADISAATGVDAMVHAIEAYTSRAANQNPISKLLAREALVLLGHNLERATKDGSDLAARSNMLLGSMLAGQAFANAPVAAVHALAYPIGGRFHIPHGLSNALVLAEVMKFNAPEAAEEYAEIAPLVFDDLVGASPAALTDSFIQALVDLSARLGLPPRLRDVGIPNEALEQMSVDAMKQTRLLVNNPRKLGQDDAFAIYSAAW